MVRTDEEVPLRRWECEEWGALQGPLASWDPGMSDIVCILTHVGLLGYECIFWRGSKRIKHIPSKLKRWVSTVTLGIWGARKQVWYSEDGEGNGLGLGWVHSKDPIYLGGISSSNLFLARAFTFFTLHSVRCPGKDRADQRDYMPWIESILTTFYGLHRVDFCLLPKVKWKGLT